MAESLFSGLQGGAIAPRSMQVGHVKTCFSVRDGLWVLVKSSSRQRGFLSGATGIDLRDEGEVASRGFSWAPSSNERKNQKLTISWLSRPKFRERVKSDTCWDFMRMQQVSLGIGATAVPGENFSWWLGPRQVADCFWRSRTFSVR